MKNTPVFLIGFGPSSTARIETPEMTRRLNAADPTMVEAARTGGFA